MEVAENFKRRLMRQFKMHFTFHARMISMTKFNDSIALYLSSTMEGSFGYNTFLALTGAASRCFHLSDSEKLFQNCFSSFWALTPQ